MARITIPDSAFKTKLLDKDFHERLIADLPQIIAKAGVPASAVWARLSDYCTPEEAEWVKGLLKPQDAGLIFVGTKFAVMASDKMSTIAGVCLRNYTDARVMPVQEVVRRLKEDNMPSPTVLLIPNFCLGKADGGDVPTWEVSNLMGLLLDRMNKELKTVLYCTSMAVVQKQYGDAFKALLEAKYSIATPDGVTLPAILAALEE